MNRQVVYTDISNLDHEAISPAIVESIGELMELKDAVAFLASERTSDVNGIAVPTEGEAGVTTR